MEHKEFEQLLEAQMQVCRQVLVVKAREYSTEDRLHNFKVAAELQGISVTQAVAGMMAKHTVSVYDMVGSSSSYSDDVWDEKITDHLNYLFLLRAAVKEEVGLSFSPLTARETFKPPFNKPNI